MTRTQPQPTGCFETQRLAISPFVTPDAAALFAYRSSPEVQLFQPWTPGSELELVDFIATQDPASLNAPDARLQLAIRKRDGGELVGDLGLHMSGGDAQQVELGFTIAPAHQSQGLATEAVRGLVGYLFDQLGKHRVLASVDPTNAASLALLRRLGMRQEAHHRESYHFRGKWVDDVVFAMLRSEWVG